MTFEYDEIYGAANEPAFEVPPLYSHQEHIANFWPQHRLMLNASDPGTGKTRATAEGFIRTPGRKRLLVVAPLSILEPSWGADIRTFTDLTYSIAHGTEKKRIAAFSANTDVVIINHDGVKWLADQKNLKQILEAFTHLAIDESTAFKHHTTQRSKAMARIAALIPYKTIMSGTFTSNTVLDAWHQVFLLDQGERLGRKFWQFRSQVCTPVQVAANSNAVRWDDRPEAQDIVSEALKDITVRFRFEECIDVPENVQHMVTLDMPQWLRDKYEELLEHDWVEHEGQIIDAAHAGARVKKALQLLSGAAYNSEGEAIRVHTERYELIIEMAQQRRATLTAYNWRHEVDNLTALAKKAKLRYAVINGDTPVRVRNDIVVGFQAGEIDHVFAHPQSAAHGLTFTRGRSTLWSSPTYNAEWWEQFNRRIYRAGQQHKTETVRVAYNDSREIEVYNRLDSKLFRMTDLLGIFSTLTQKKVA